ncbi:MAG: hypothetical protein QM784_05210 [Polyangiaceae bacterium]
MRTLLFAVACSFVAGGVMICLLLRGNDGVDGRTEPFVVSEPLRSIDISANEKEADSIGQRFGDSAAPGVSSSVEVRPVDIQSTAPSVAAKKGDFGTVELQKGVPNPSDARRDLTPQSPIQNRLDLSRESFESGESPDKGTDSLDVVTQTEARGAHGERARPLRTSVAPPAHFDRPD